MSVVKKLDSLSTSEKISLAAIVLFGLLGLALWITEWLPFDAYLIFGFGYLNYLLTLQKPQSKYPILQEKMVFEANHSHGFETWNTLAYIIFFMMMGLFLDKSYHFDGGLQGVVFLGFIFLLSLLVRWLVKKIIVKPIRR